jgi:hypothetical protein
MYELRISRYEYDVRIIAESKLAAGCFRGNRLKKLETRDKGNLRGFSAFIAASRFAKKLEA